MQPKFHGKIKNGVFVVDGFQEAQRQAYLEGLEGKEVEEIVQKPSKSKTLQQLRYVHGVVFKLASEASGYTPEEVKGLLKGQFLTKYVKLSDKGPKFFKEVPIVRSLADLKTDEMAGFIDECIILIAKHWHCVIPSPEEVSF